MKRQTVTAIAAVLVVAALVGAGLLVHLTLGLLAVRIAAVAPDSARAASALTQLFASDHPRVRVRVVAERSLTAAADALGRREADLAVVRSDAAGQESLTLVILRREAVVFLAPGHSPVDAIGKLHGRTVGLLSDKALDTQLLDRVLQHYGIAPTAVNRIILPTGGVLEAVRRRRVDALFVVAPLDGTVWLPLFAALRKGSEGPPKTFAVDEAAAIARDEPGLETLDVPKGALQGSLPAPDDDVTTLSVSYRLVARRTMPDWLAGEITREVLTNKPKLAALDPGLSDIEAPDTDDKAAALPIHAGAAAYLSGSLPSLSDQVQNAFYWLGLTASAAASLVAATAAVYRRVRPRQPPTRVMRLLEIWLTARSDGPVDVVTLERQTDVLVHEAIRAQVRGQGQAEEMRLVTLIASHVREALRRRN